MKVISFICCLLLSFGLMYPQAEFVKTYDYYSTGPTHLLQLEDSAYVISSVNHFSTGGGLILMKVAPNGDTIWTRDHGGPYRSDRIYWLLEAGDGGFYFGGRQATPDPSSGGNSQFYAVKVDSEGYEEWTLVWQIDSVNSIVDAVVAPDGGLYFFGDYGPSRGASIYSIVGRISATGNLLWTRNISDGYHSPAVALHPDGGFIMLLRESRFGFRHYAENGDSLSTTFFNDPVPRAKASEIIPKPNGNWILVGRSSISYRGKSVVMAEVTPSGSVIWYRQHAIKDYSISIGEGDLADNGDIALAGTYFIPVSSGESRIWIGRYSDIGVPICSRLYGNSIGGFDGANYCEGMVATLDGGFALAGTLGSYISLIKTDQLCKTFSPPPVGSAFPNPFTDQINLNVEIEGQGNAEVIIYNSVGQEILNCGLFTLIDGRLSCTCNTETLSQGIYILKVRTLENELAFKVFK